MSLPTPTVRKSKTQRSVKLNYPTGVAHDGGTKQAQVYVYHSAHRKAFIASLHLVTVKQENGYTTEAFFPFSGVTLASKPVARYSEKALDAFVVEVQALLPSLIESNEKVAAIFRGEGE